MQAPAIDSQDRVAMGERSRNESPESTVTNSQADYYDDGGRSSIRITPLVACAVREIATVYSDFRFCLSWTSGVVEPVLMCMIGVVGAALLRFFALG